MGVQRLAGLRLVAIFFSIGLFSAGLISKSANAESNPRLQSEKILLDHRNELGLRLVGQRFIDPQDWEAALRGLFPNGDVSPRTYYQAPPGTPPYFAYGEAEFEAFLMATRYVNLNGESRLPSVNDYLKVHELAYGFPESFAVTHAYSAETLTAAADRRRATLWLNRGESQKLVAAGLVPPRLGVLRDHTSDGRALGSGGRHRVNADELRRLQLNSSLRVTVVESYPDSTFFVEIAYPPGNEVRPLLDGLFARVEKDAARLLSKGRRPTSAAYQLEVVRIASYFYLGLIETHGLWDGNGRTSKLTRDWLLRYFGLDVPFETPADDHALSQIDYQTMLANEIEVTRQMIDSYTTGALASRAEVSCAREIKRRLRP